MNTRTIFYILVDGEPVPEPDVAAWSRWMEESREDRVLARTMIGNGVVVSTVFLGIDHSWTGANPILYETMIFGGEHDQDQWRYATLDEAVLGHQAAIALVRDDLEQ